MNKKTQNTIIALIAAIGFVAVAILLIHSITTFGQNLAKQATVASSKARVSSVEEKAATTSSKSKSATSKADKSKKVSAKSTTKKSVTPQKVAKKADSTIKKKSKMTLEESAEKDKQLYAQQIMTFVENVADGSNPNFNKIIAAKKKHGTYYVHWDGREDSHYRIDVPNSNGEFTDHPFASLQFTKPTMNTRTGDTFKRTGFGTAHSVADGPRKKDNAMNNNGYIPISEVQKFLDNYQGDLVSVTKSTYAPSQLGVSPS